MSGLAALAVPARAQTQDTVKKSKTRSHHTSRHAYPQCVYPNFLFTAVSCILCCALLRRRSLDARTPPAARSNWPQRAGPAPTRYAAHARDLQTLTVGHAGSGTAIACRTPSISISAAFSAVRGCAR